MKLSNFQSYLTAKSPPVLARNEGLQHNLNDLMTWAAGLPMLPEDEQFTQIETILTELCARPIEDALRLKLMDIVISAANPLIANLRSHYIHESGSLSAQQLTVMDKVKGLYEQMLLVFDGVVERERHLLVKADHQVASAAKNTNASVWGWLKPAPVTQPPMVLACAIYHTLSVYQKLDQELALCYQKLPAEFWQAIHKHYAEACQFDIAHVNLSVTMVTKNAINIHQLYCQICLHSLLNVLAMRRPSMLLIQRLLPEWSAHIIASFEPQSATRIFVDLNRANPPEYVSATSKINPYSDGHWCLFIELEPLAQYLRQRQNTLIATNNNLTEYRLVTTILMAITHRYLNRSLKSISKYSPKARATLITHFNAIHYFAAHNIALMDMIALHDLSLDYLPQYDTAPKKDATSSSFEVEVLDHQGELSHFRTLRSLTVQDIAAFEQRVIKNSQNTSAAPILPPLNQIFEPINIEQAKETDEAVLDKFLATAPPHLQIMNLFLLKEHGAKPDTCALGLIRWLSLEDEFIEAEAQILGHAPTACALRIDERDSRSQSFVPALLLAAEESLGSNCSLLVPAYHFKAGDKVVIRLNDKQKTLRLQDSILSTEEFTQFEVIRL
ncbi:MULTISPECIES: hypothetical protein [Psychrobacter]|uniref:hypothetical protein n=1 Tax=Psychrobacter TaxID=497 RepID=UPI00146CDFC3|nr:MULTISPECIES: hypothetical protein [Psychrobacter]